MPVTTNVHVQGEYGARATEDHECGLPGGSDCPQSGSYWNSIKALHQRLTARQVSH